MGSWSGYMGTGACLLKGIPEMEMSGMATGYGGKCGIDGAFTDLRIGGGQIKARSSQAGTQLRNAPEACSETP